MQSSVRGEGEGKGRLKFEGFKSFLGNFLTCVGRRSKQSRRELSSTRSSVPFCLQGGGGGMGGVRGQKLGDSSGK